MTHSLRVFVVYLVLALSTSATADIPPDFFRTLNAEFRHDEVRTILSDKSAFVLAENQGTGQNVFVLGGFFESGLVSWEIDGVNDGAGPLMISLAAPVGEEAINDWMMAPKSAQSDPTLFIPVTLLSEVLVDDDSEPSRVWSNSADVTARIFVRDCEKRVFRRFGDMLFDEGAITFTANTDSQGDRNVNADAVHPRLIIDEQTWSILRTDCGLGDLPVAPGDGVGEFFVLSNAAPPHRPETIPGVLQDIRDGIRHLLFDKSIDTDTAGSLFETLNTAADLVLQPDKLKGAIAATAEFRELVIDLMEQGSVDIKDGEALISGTDEFDTLANLLAQPPDPVPRVEDFCPAAAAVCPVREPCTSTVFYVSNTDHPSPDGTAAAPFRTIVEALQRAQKILACGVEVMLGEGGYSGDLFITRDTQLIGTALDPDDRPVIFGTISNYGQHRLEVQNVNIRSAGGDGIVSDDACATTVLSDVSISGAQGYGVHQRGGLLFANDTIVRGTRVRPETLSTGTGVLMTCGAQAVFSDITLTVNESSGLLMSGPGTSAFAVDLGVFGTGVHPGFATPDLIGPWGAVHVQSEAELNVFGFAITDNLYAGVRVERDAQVSLTGTPVMVSEEIAEIETCGPDFRWPNDPTRRANRLIALAGYASLSVEEERCAAGATRPVPGGGTSVVYSLDIINGQVARSRTIPNLLGRPAGGSNVLVGGGALRLSNVELAHAGLAGLHLVRRGEADFHTGIVSHSPIGAAIQVPGFDVSRISNEVDYRNNDTDLDARELPVPGTPTL